MIVAEHLGKAYGRKAAVADLSFTVRPGVVTGFLGPNGAGKSTAMRLMLGLDHGTGSTLFDGRRFAELRQPMREIGTVLEAKSFHPTRSARGHLRMLAAGNGITRRRVDDVLALVGLTDVARRGPRGFSLGMSQRLGLAAALLGDPHTLILDEPANGLDPAGIQWLRDLLKQLAAQDRTIFVSSHLLSEMALMADDLVVIGRGRLIDAGPVQDFIAKFTGRSVLVASPSIDELVRLLPFGTTVTRQTDGTVLVHSATAREVGELAANHGLVLHELATRSATLEDAFLQATEGSEEFVGGNVRGHDSIGEVLERPRGSQAAPVDDRRVTSGHRRRR